jgi:hypothetical protein
LAEAAISNAEIATEFGANSGRPRDVSVSASETGAEFA